jgi:hypothetical protein
MKDMYKGSLMVIGDPSVKPHDAMYLADFTSTMNGTCLVKSVTHHMSVETGFVTSIEPDAYVVNDDLVMLSVGSWFASVGIGLSALAMSFSATTGAIKAIQKSKTIGKLVNSGKGLFSKMADATVKTMLDMIGDDIDEVKAYKAAFTKYYNLPSNATDALRNQALDALDKAGDDLNKKVDSLQDAYKNQKWFSQGRKDAKASLKNARLLARQTKGISNSLRLGKAAGGLAMKSAFQVGKAIFASTGVGTLITIGVTVATEGIFEMYARYKEALQCVIMIPLQYRGIELTSGINGHKGMVVGDNPGKLDILVSAVAGEKDASDDAGQWYNWVFETMNWLSGSEKDYSTTQEEISQNPTVTD